MAVREKVGNRINIEIPLNEETRDALVLYGIIESSVPEPSLENLTDYLGVNGDFEEHSIFSPVQLTEAQISESLQRLVRSRLVTEYVDKEKHSFGYGKKRYRANITSDC